jgi:uncharacterized membrane protein
VGVSPKTRRKAAVYLLIVSLVLGHVNLAGALAGYIPAWLTNLVTNYLSWLAITLTALDILLTADVRVEQDEGER